MKVTFLGTGTSHGIPVIGCHCPVCSSSDPRDMRYRSSVLLEKDGKNLLIDTGYELRLQLLRARCDMVDAVLYTHSHSDHMSGLDDLRVFTYDRDLKVYGNESTIGFIKTHYAYAVSERSFPGVPHIIPEVLEPYVHHDISGFDVVSLTVEHGLRTHMPIFAYRIEKDFAYVTDTSFIPPESLEALRGVKVLVIGALRKKPHGAHFTFEQAHEAALEIGAERTYFTHINHETSYNEICSLYDGCLSAYDTLTITI